MNGLIKKFVLVTLLLQFCLFVQTVGQPQPQVQVQPILGDILRFDRLRICTGKSVYSHYAIFVGDIVIPGKERGQNIFEMTKWNGGTGCRFGTLQGQFIIDNDRGALDRLNDNEIIQAVQNMNQNCGGWTPFNTCEHIATSVRFGDIHRECIQQNTLMEVVCRLINYIQNLRNNHTRAKRSKYLRAAAAAAAA